MAILLIVDDLEVLDSFPREMELSGYALKQEILKKVKVIAHESGRLTLYFCAGESARRRIGSLSDRLKFGGLYAISPKYQLSHQEITFDDLKKIIMPYVCRGSSWDDMSDLKVLRQNLAESTTYAELTSCLRSALIGPNEASEFADPPPCPELGPVIVFGQKLESFDWFSGVVDLSGPVIRTQAFESMWVLYEANGSISKCRVMDVKKLDRTGGLIAQVWYGGFYQAQLRLQIEVDQLPLGEAKQLVRAALQDGSGGIGGGNVRLAREEIRSATSFLELVRATRAGQD